MYTKAVLGVYELTRVELLRDLFVWSYEQSIQKYPIIKKDIGAEPNKLRLKYYHQIKKIIYDIVTHPDNHPLDYIQTVLTHNLEITPQDRTELRAILINEIRMLHEGKIMHYGLNIEQFHHWKKNTG